MKAIIVFLVLTAAIAAVQLVGAGIAYVLGHGVIALGWDEIWAAWAVCGILAAVGAIGVAMRMARQGRSRDERKYGSPPGA